MPLIKKKVDFCWFIWKYNIINIIIISTSSASESAFSIGGHIDRKTRARLSSKIWRYAILTREEEKIEQILNESGIARYFFKMTFVTHVFCFENMKKVNLISKFVRYLTNNALFLFDLLR